MPTRINYLHSKLFFILHFFKKILCNWLCREWRFPTAFLLAFWPNLSCGWLSVFLTSKQIVTFINHQTGHFLCPLMVQSHLAVMASARYHLGSLIGIREHGRASLVSFLWCCLFHAWSVWDFFWDLRLLLDIRAHSFRLLGPLSSFMQILRQSLPLAIYICPSTEINRINLEMWQQARI